MRQRPLLRLRDRRRAAGRLAADWLTVGLGPERRRSYVAAPAAAVVEEVAGALAAASCSASRPARRSAFVTGCQMAHVTGLAAARHHVLAAPGWDVERDGLVGAPPVRVVVGDEPARDRSTGRCGCSGFGTDAVARGRRPTTQGRMDAGALRRRSRASDGPTIVCAQAGNVNTGACDPFDADRGRRRRRRRVAARRRRLRPLGRGVARRLRHLVARRRAGRLVGDRRPQVAERAVRLRDRVLRRIPTAHRAAMGIRAAYLVHADADDGARPGRLEPGVLAARTRRSPSTPRCARSAAPASPSSSSAAARTPGDSPPGSSSFAGRELLNEVVLNQVLVRFDDRRARPSGSPRAMQAGGEAWMGTTLWDGRRAIRISVSSRLTSGDDVRRTIDAFAAIRRSGPVASRPRPASPRRAARRGTRG